MAQLNLSLLGPFQAIVDDQPVTAFPTDKVRALLAFLALEADRPHRREELAGLFWPDWAEEDARRNLRQSLHRLRATLDAAAPGLAGRLLHADQTTVRLDPSALVLDVAEFRRLLAEVEEHRHRTLPTCQACTVRLQQAVDLYRGELLAGLSLPDAPAFEEWQTVQREALHFQIVAALEGLAVACEQRREYLRSHTLTVRQLALDPWNEPAHRRAMHSLALAGQRGEALAHYDACRQLLVDELGEEPAAETKALYWQIASGELQAAPEDAERIPFHNCPSQFTRFVGRQRELAQLLEMLHNPDCRLITIVGAGGMGKTRLAIEAAHSAASMVANYPDGIFFVALEDVSTPDLLAPAIANSLGLATEAELPAEQVIEYLRSRQLLLVLDNFEHHLPGGGLVLDIVRTAPGVQVMVTSQLPLELRAEWRLNLAGLALSSDDTTDPALEDYEAGQLFVQAASQAQPGFSPSDADRRAIAQICRLVQGMPLAIELAAAWVRLTDCQTIAGEIGRNLDFLATRLHDLPLRHRSVRAVFDYAWQLLGPSEQAALAQVSVFRGSFGLLDALAICDATVLDLTSVIDRSLLGKAAQERFVVHPLLRQFAGDLLEQSGDAHRTRQRHAAYFAGRASDLGRALRGGPDQLRALGEMELEIENVTAAWDWAAARCDEQALACMLDGLFDFRTIRSRFREGELHLRASVQQLAAAAPVRLIAHLEARLAWFVFHQGRIEEARLLLEGSLATLRDQADLAGAVFCHSYLGALLRHAGQLDAAHTLLTDGLQLAREAGDDYFVGVILNLLGQVASLQGRLDEARASLRLAMEVKRRIGDRWGITFSYSYLGRVAQAEGSHAEASDLLRESLLLSQEFGDRRGIAFALFNLGASAEALGRRAEALELYRQSLHVYDDIGSRADAERVRSRLASI